MRPSTTSLVSLALIVAASSAAVAGDDPEGAEMEQPSATAAEHDQLIDHVHRIFDAFLARDRDLIRDLHTEDWVGFLGPSTTIERGIDDYMVNADRSLQSFRGVSYEIFDTEVQIHGEIALVFYVARYDYENEDGRKGSIPLRSIDVFRRRNGDWRQSASHIAVIPSGGRWGEGEDQAAAGSRGE